MATEAFPHFFFFLKKTIAHPAVLNVGTLVHIYIFIMPCPRNTSRKTVDLMKLWMLFIFKPVSLTSLKLKCQVLWVPA